MWAVWLNVVQTIGHEHVLPLVSLVLTYPAKGEHPVLWSEFNS